MSYKRISIRFNLDIEDERNAWELLHSSSCGPINKEVIDSINTAHKLSTLEALLRKVISEVLIKTAGTMGMRRFSWALPRLERQKVILRWS